MFCDLGLHRADPAAIWNGGVGFSRCLRCRQDLVRRPGLPWARVPRGLAIVWRPKGQAARAQQLSRQAGPAPIVARVIAGTLALAHRLGASPGKEPREKALNRASRDYRYLVRRIAATQARGAPVRTILVSAMCDASVANEALLLLSAMMQDELGGRLLVIDATLGADGVSAMMGAQGVPGLSEARGGDPWAALEMVRLSPRRSLCILGRGLDPAASRPEDMSAILPFLAGRFDHVLIQQRAITADTRNLALASLADLVLVLAREGETPMAGLAQARGAFRSSGIANVGLVLAASPAPGRARPGRLAHAD